MYMVTPPEYAYAHVDSLPLAIARRAESSERRRDGGPTSEAIDRTRAPIDEGFATRRANATQGVKAGGVVRKTNQQSENPRKRTTNALGFRSRR